MSTPEDAPPAPPPRRRFVLARLADAVRRQDWFTVLVEIAIVVLGVVIGFQVTAWGQARSDRAKEQVYLRQLVDDLRETEDAVARSEDTGEEWQYRAATQLLQAWGSPERPPRDSVLVWLRASGRFVRVRPVLGTVEALVATGDLGLIRNDSLRSNITAYLDHNRDLIDDQEAVLATQIESSAHGNGAYDNQEALLFALSDSARIAYAAETPISGLIPTGAWRPPFPFSMDRYFASESEYFRLTRSATAQSNIGLIQGRMAESARELREQVEAALDG